MTKTPTGVSEQLAQCKEEVAVLKDELAECRDAAETEHSLLNSGLRLAQENEALRSRVTGLLEEQAESSPEYASGNSPSSEEIH